MQASTLRLSLLSVVLTAAAAPALAGNYAEGDPRPVATTSTTSSSAVAAETRAWSRTAPTLGYPQGDSKPLAVQVTSRAAVEADTMRWVRSGLSSVQYSEAGADAARPAFRQAAHAYATAPVGQRDAQASQAPSSRNGAAQ